MHRVLITGATGFIGQHLCPALLAAGYVVRGTYRKSSAVTALPKAMEWVHVADVGPETDWSEALEGVDYVVHLAGLAHYPGTEDDALGEAFERVNVRGTAKLVDALRQSQVARLVFLSSAKAVPVPGLGKADGTADSNYGRSKQASESVISKVLADCKTDWCTLRPCLVYGPGNLGNMARLIRLVNSGLPLPFASIRNHKSFLYIGNLISAIQLVLTHPAASRRTFTLSDGEPISTPELISCLGRYGRHKARLFPMPLRMMKAVAHMGDRVNQWTGISPGWDSYSVERLCSSLVVDSSEFCQELGWAPPYSMEEGLRITMAEASTVLTNQVQPQISADPAHSLRSVDGMPSTQSILIKRIFDLVLALVLFPLLTIPMLTIAVAILLTSRGPVLYWSDRVGRLNRIFRMPKFRTMQVDAPQVATHLMKDPARYLTPVGSFLRKTSLDELPQIFCIASGHLSFVGPRPALFNQDDLVVLRTQRGIHELVPGVTGWAQINGRDDLSIPQKVEFDYEYLRRRSFGFDLKIILLTIWKAARREGVSH